MAAALRSVSPDFSLLPKDRSFGDLLPTFFLPYFAYVAIPGFLSELIGPDLAQLLRFAVVGGLLVRFRKAYAFGPRLTAPQALLALAAHVLLDLSWTVAALIGAALAPTDPAVTFSVLAGKEVEGRSGTILEGESGFNDPVGIALMIGMVELATSDDGIDPSCRMRPQPLSRTRIAYAPSAHSPSMAFNSRSSRDRPTSSCPMARAAVLRNMSGV